MSVQGYLHTLSEQERVCLARKLVDLFLYGNNPSLSQQNQTLPAEQDQNDDVSIAHYETLPTQSNTIFDRLYSENQKKKHDLHLYEEQKRDLELRGCTFRPEINTNTQILAERYHSTLSQRQTSASLKRSLSKLDNTLQRENTLSNSVMRKNSSQTMKMDLEQLRQKYQSSQTMLQIPGMQISEEKSCEVTTPQAEDVISAKSRPTRKDPHQQSTERKSTSRGQLRSELLYQNFKDKQDRMIIKRAEIEHERMKDCSFQPSRDAVIQPGPKTAQMQYNTRFLEGIDQFERVYKFNVDSVLKKYQPSGNSEGQPILLTAQQRERHKKQEEIKGQIVQNKVMETKIRGERMTRLMKEIDRHQRVLEKSPALSRQQRQGGGLFGYLTEGHQNNERIQDKSPTTTESDKKGALPRLKSESHFIKGGEERLRVKQKSLTRQQTEIMLQTATNRLIRMEENPSFNETENDDRSHVIVVVNNSSDSATV
ncbi:hypothetical protein FGO68_gene16639 [Halteria grandinella]|uniref:Uncharacterized protein n=1 Tax=Halteria grandinella TaxID=5974 RepID=A0A8J8NZ03_HALGN|nr:hypothetical protein FGO68_gene16639 [Halteria grandinella]